MEKHAEILAPAGGEAQLRAAVLCGADAVYLGLRGFNARAGAENFDENTLPQTVGWCHARGVRVYVTLNTLVTDRELPQWLHSLDAVAAAGVDGVLVQDLGLAKIIRQRYPTLPLHASTQMTIHNLAGHLRRDKHAVRGLCARGAVHERFRAMLPQQRAGGAQRQPRALRPALPAGL